MARLEAVEKMLYYPTDIPTLKSLTRHIKMYGHGGHSIYLLDPCVGEGLAVNAFRNGLKDRIQDAVDAKREEIRKYNETDANIAYRTRTYGYDYYLRSLEGELDSIKGWLDTIELQGVELDIQRAQAARELLGGNNVLESGFEYVTVTGQFNVLFMNPPYDLVNGRRAELTWIDMAAPALAAEGSLVVLIVPDMFVGEGRYVSEMQKCLRNNGISDATVLRFPNHSYPKFKQVAILAKKNKPSSYYYAESINLTVRGVIGECDVQVSWKPCQVSSNPMLTKMELRTTLESILTEDISKLQSIIGSPNSGGKVICPLIPMRTEHSAMMAAAGQFNGVIVNRKVIKGGTIKRIIHTEEARGERGAVITDREVFAAMISELDLASGEIVSVNNLDDTEAFEEKIKSNAHELVEVANKLFPAQFLPEDVERYAAQISRVRAPRKIRGHQNGLWTAQKYRAAAILHHWSQGNKVATMYGEMATGKTAVSMAATAIKAMQRKPHNQKVIVLLPPKMDLINKWEEEIKMSLREFNPVVVHVETISDVRKAFNQDGLTYILIKETTAKMSSGWAPVIPPARPASAKYERSVLCPTCGAPLEYDNEKPDKEKSHCATCNTPMWTVTRRKSGKGTGDGYARYPLARYIRDHYRGRYILIIDEAHNMKAADSARGYAANDLLVSAEYALQMTGTLYNGMASSIYYLLWRALPEFRETWGWQDVQQFIDKYGLFEEVTTVSDTRWKSYSSKSGYREYTTRKNEKPGIHPLMMAELLPSTVFFALRDLEIEMPPYAEHTLFVEKPDEFYEIDRYLDDIRSDAIAKMQKGDMSLLSQFTWAAQGAWDVPSIGDAVDGHTLSPVDCPGDMWPKEEALLRLIAQEKRAGRKVLCFVGQINRRDPTGRLCELLESYGMKGAVMRAEVTERVKFIRNAIKNGVDVIFTSAQLVKEGIDLLECPTFVWMYGEMNTYLVQQANRRSWRPGQENDVHIYYLAYNNTPQAERMHRLAKKVGAAQTLHGDVQQGLAALLGEQDFVSKLQNIVVSTEHFESDMTIDDLPELEDFIVTTTAPPLVDVVVEVMSRKPVRIHVTVEEIKSYSQMSLF
jgi:hypothetical protein